MEDTGFGKKLVVKDENEMVGGSALQIDAGKKTDMIFHHHTNKVVYLISGAMVVTVIRDGQLQSLMLKQGASFFVRAGLVHQYEAREKSVVIEYVSNIQSFESDVTIISRGSVLQKPENEGDFAKMPPNYEKAMEEKAEVVEETLNKKKTSKKAPAKKKTTRKKSKKKVREDN